SQGQARSAQPLETGTQNTSAPLLGRDERFFTHPAVLLFRPFRAPGFRLDPYQGRRCRLPLATFSRAFSAQKIPYLNKLAKLSTWVKPMIVCSFFSLLPGT